jgi:hypothetical protein
MKCKQPKIEPDFIHKGEMPEANLADAVDIYCDLLIDLFLERENAKAATNGSGQTKT